MANPSTIGVLCLLLVGVGAARTLDMRTASHQWPNHDGGTQRYLLFGEQVPINAGSASALETVPGVGPALAQRIVRYRAEHGDFTSAEGLTGVSGIGPLTSDQIGSFLSWQPSSHTLDVQTDPKSPRPATLRDTRP